MVPKLKVGDPYPLFRKLQIHKKKFHA